MKHRSMTALATRTAALSGSAAAALLALSASPALAGGSDIAITNIGGKVVTGTGDHSFYPNESEFPERVFGADLLEQGGFVFTDEPGWLGPFDNVGEGFAPGSSLGFNIRRALRTWTGDDFLAGPAAERMRLYDSGPGTNEVFTPLTDVLVPGFAVIADANVHALGGFDEHPFYELTTSTPGIYLLELEIWSSDPNVATSDPIWLVFNYGLSEPEHEEAIEWTEANLVPAPGSLALLAGAGLLSGRCRRSA